jgi:hypothetical protein
MSNKLTLTSAILILLSFGNLAFAATSVPLNTGYDHWWGTAYGTAPAPLGLPKQDDYWINVSTATNFIPTFAIQKHPNWQAAFAGTNWINFQNNFNSMPGTSSTNLKYFVYRKCFCLQPGFVKPALKFQLRADDSVAVWFNSVTNPVINGTGGSFSGPPLNGSTERGFRTGSNCLYVLVEDAGVATGFDLEGNVTALAGLLATPAKGPNQSYAPCGCGNGPAGAAMRMEASPDDDKEVIQEILKFAEERRLKAVGPAIKRN